MITRATRRRSRHRGAPPDLTTLGVLAFTVLAAAFIVAIILVGTARNDDTGSPNAPSAPATEPLPELVPSSASPNVGANGNTITGLIWPTPPSTPPVTTSSQKIKPLKDLKAGDTVLHGGTLCTWTGWGDSVGAQPKTTNSVIICKGQIHRPRTVDLVPLPQGN